MLQKFLTPSLKTNEKSAEKFCLNSMKNVLTRSGRRDHNGLWNRGRQCVCKRGTSTDGVLISDGYAEKYKIKTGDTIVLKEAYGSETYEFTVQGSTIIRHL